MTITTWMVSSSALRRSSSSTPETPGISMSESTSDGRGSSAASAEASAASLTGRQSSGSDAR